MIHIVRLRCGAIAGVIVFLGSCGTMNESQVQTIAIKTTGAPGALCSLYSPTFGEKTLVSPGSITLPRSNEEIHIHCVKECFEDVQSVAHSNVSWGQGGALMLLQGPLGATVDAATGTAFKYDYFTDLPMHPKACVLTRRGPPEKDATWTAE